jgi:uncharacterized membrane protein YeaQ/YmgE (transglycosylase-associated protein family)
MAFVSWLILGLIAGFIGNKIVDNQGQGAKLSIVLGIVGAIFGGLIFSALRDQGFTDLNVSSMIVAIMGSIVVLAAYHAFAGQGRQNL